MKSAFLTQLASKPMLLFEHKDHRNYINAIKQLITFQQLDTGSSIVLLTGPSNCGKTSILSAYAAKVLELETGNASLWAIGANAQTAREGRTAPKYIYGMLLQDMQHPLYDPAKQSEYQSAYRPSRKGSEVQLLMDLTNAIKALQVRQVVIDEAQFLSRAKSPDYRASLIESFKSLATTTTSVIFSGGYEFADVILGMRPHLAARVIPIHLARYSLVKEDIEEWKSVLQHAGACKGLNFASDDLLINHWERLLEECHGLTGVLERRLMLCQMVASAGSGEIDEGTLNSTAPATETWNTIRTDIERGEALLAADSRFLVARSTPAPPVDEKAKDPDTPRKNKFNRKPKRSY